jgi:hypothetical protein
MQKVIKATIGDFEDWLRDRGYNVRMGEDNFRMFLSMGFSGLLFNNSALLMSFIFSKLGLSSERINEKVRFELSRKVEKINVSKDSLEIVVSLNE